MKKSMLFDAFYKNAGYLAVVLVSLAYIGSSFIIISKTGKSALEIIASGVISMTVGLLINGVFRSMGVSRGECDEKTLQTAKLYSQSIDEISPYFDRLEEFCERENKRETKRVRCQILASGGLRYSDFYDEDGNFVKKEDYTECMNEYITCIDEKLGIYPLTDDLIYIIQNRGEFEGWWDKDAPNFLLTTVNNINPDIAWMFLLCYVK